MAPTTDREALVDAFLSSLRALLLAGTAEGCAPPVPNRDDRTLRVKDVAELYRVTVKSVYDWVGSGMLPALRLPGRDGAAGSYRFRDADLAEFDRRRECNWTPPAPVVLTPAGETGPARASRSNAFQRGARLGAVPLPARAAAVLVAAGAA
jgi:Helix-turn-helix domain